jgi:cytochrome c oxidase subunit 3
MANAHAPDSSHYYIPHDSPWPIRGSIALFAMMLGAIGYLDNWAGAWVFLPGAVLLAYMFFGWFSTVIDENQHGIYNLQVDRSFRMGMMWFIFSEVMFFAAFFGALFYARMLSVPWLGGQGVKVFTNFILWPQFEGVWPTNGPAHVGGHADGSFSTIPAIGVPALNTAILLTSGLTVTIAHHALRAGRRGRLALFLALTFLLGFTFVSLQAHEYGEAYRELGLRLDVLHAHRLPRPARDGGRDHAHGHLAAGVARALHRHPAFRLRGGRLVLALRRRGVARPVHLCLLAVDARPLLRMRRDAAGLQAVGRDQPQVPGEHQQRKQHQRHGDADGEGARQLARIVGAAARQMKQPEAEAREDPRETRQDQHQHQCAHGAQCSAGVPRGSDPCRAA